jgi:hypothetical protein
MSSKKVLIDEEDAECLIFGEGTWWVLKSIFPDLKARYPEITIKYKEVMQ